MAQSATPPSVLEVSPSVLSFPPPFDRVITNILKIHNISDKYVTFKIKTTAPKRYFVRPSLGLIKPGDTHEVQVILNVIKSPIAANDKTKDFFQIQSMNLDTGKYSIDVDLKDLWKDVDENKITKQRIKSRLGTGRGSHISGSLPLSSSGSSLDERKGSSFQETALKSISDSSDISAFEDTHKPVGPRMDRVSFHEGPEVSKPRDAPSLNFSATSMSAVIDERNTLKQKLDDALFRLREVTQERDRLSSQIQRPSLNAFSNSSATRNTPIYTQPWVIVLMVALLGYLFGKYI